MAGILVPRLSDDARNEYGRGQWIGLSGGEELVYRSVVFVAAGDSHSKRLSGLGGDVWP